MHERFISIRFDLLAAASGAVDEATFEEAFNTSPAALVSHCSSIIRSNAFAVRFPPAKTLKINY